MFRRNGEAQPGLRMPVVLGSMGRGVWEMLARRRQSTGKTVAKSAAGRKGRQD